MLFRMVENAMQSHPNKIALQLGRERITYREFYRWVVDSIFNLNNAGFRAMPQSILALDHLVSTISTFFALSRISRRLLVLEPQEATASRLRNILRDVDPFFLVGGAFPVKQWRASPLRNNKILQISEDRPSVLNQLRPEPLRTSSTGGDSLVLQLTSGSMGRPKIALHNHRSLVQGARIYRTAFELNEEDRILVAVPITHSYGMVGGLLAAFASNATIILLNRFVPQLVTDLISNEKVTVLVAVPFIYEVLIRCDPLGKMDCRSLRLCLSSGAPLSQAVRRDFESRYGKQVWQIYGTTEVGIIASQRGEDLESEACVGPPLPSVQVRIVDRDGQDVDRGESGRILVKTQTMFLGYLDDAAATAASLQDGWYETGDLGRQDVSGAIYLQDRLPTFINVYGRKVNPLEVEAVLCAHPAIRAAVIFEAWDNDIGGTIKGAVVATGRVSAEALLGYCRRHLPPHSVPMEILFVDELPKSPLGKPMRVGESSSPAS